MTVSIQRRMAGFYRQRPHADPVVLVGRVDPYSFSTYVIDDSEYE